MDRASHGQAAAFLACPFRIQSNEPYADIQQLTLPISIRTRDGSPGHLRVVVSGERDLTDEPNRT